MSVRTMLGAVLCLSALVTVTSAEILGTTENGRKVILNDNGTWKYAEEQQKDVPAADKTSVRSPSTSEKIDLLRGKASVYYNPNKWRNIKEAQPGRFELSHKDGDGYAVVIAERMQVSLEGLRNIALNNARQVAPDAHSVVEEKRLVNGAELLFMQIDATSQEIPFTFLGYYYVGPVGSVQVLTYTAANLVEEYRKDMDEFLNGFQVNKQ